MRWTQWFSHKRSPSTVKGKENSLRALTILKLTRNYSILSTKKLLGIDMFNVGSYILETKKIPFHLLRVEKMVKR